MKKNIILLLFVICIQSLKAQFVTIPDANFVGWLQANVPSAMNGNQMDINSPAVTTRTSVAIGSSGILDITGIQYFDSLRILNCANNSLTFLPSLPNSLYNLNCSSNQLTNLPTLPNSLNYLYCQNNQLTTLPTLPGSLKSLLCFNNQIYCFPKFPTSIMSLLAGNNPFDCVPNYIPAMNSTMMSYPLCSYSDTIGACSFISGLSGYVYNDNTGDCLYNTGDLALKNIPVKVFDNNAFFLGQVNSFINGDYGFADSAGTYNVIVDTLNKPYQVQCIYPGGDSIVTLTSSASFADDINFSLNCKPGFDVGIQSIVAGGLIFPGQTHIIDLVAGDMSHWYNLNCASVVQGVVSFSISGPVSYVGQALGALTPVITGNIFTYNIADFGTISNASDFRVLFQTNTSAQPGDQICISGTVTPVNGDNNTSNNIYNYCYVVSNSLDPNIKEVYSVQVSSNFNDWLTYIIHFQNTGNAAAINIRLEDELDTKLNPESFQVINYSHNNLIDLTGNHLTVRFPNIQLADSTSDPEGSIGFIQYRIKPHSGWITDTIKNSASIYFDYNSPIVTNTAKSYFMSATTVSSLGESRTANIMPNPSNGLVTIIDNSYFSKIELFSITGQTLLSELVDSNTYNLQLQNFAEGIYFVKVSYSDDTCVTRKIIKQ